MYHVLGNSTEFSLGVTVVYVFCFKQFYTEYTVVGVSV